MGVASRVMRTGLGKACNHDVGNRLVVYYDRKFYQFPLGHRENRGGVLTLYYHISLMDIRQPDTKKKQKNETIQAIFQEAISFHVSTMVSQLSTMQRCCGVLGRKPGVLRSPCRQVPRTQQPFRSQRGLDWYNRKCMSRGKQRLSAPEEFGLVRRTSQLQFMENQQMFVHSCHVRDSQGASERDHARLSKNHCDYRQASSGIHRHHRPKRVR
ncbi:hypothetical protein F5B21DRAFT_324138 [Xylaria acuta]|nr:hypothetical protein F5B21DRAFT_324138 [Xylaria acuta]